MLHSRSSIHIAAVCCTYKRPKELETAIECYLRQDYPKELCELIILDDAGQYKNQEGDGWKIISIPNRFRTLGEKRNASIALVSSEVEAYCVWDDDDIYLPWHISSCAMSLANSDYTIPTIVYEYNKRGVCLKHNESRYHGSWSFRRTAFDAVGGYPFIYNGEDMKLLRKFRKSKLSYSDPIQINQEPSYIYRWFVSHDMHISSPSCEYDKLGENITDENVKITPNWDTDWLDLVKNVTIK